MVRLLGNLHVVFENCKLTVLLKVFKPELINLFNKLLDGVLGDGGTSLCLCIGDLVVESVDFICLHLRSSLIFFVLRLYRIETQL